MKIIVVSRSFDQRLGGMERHTKLMVDHFLRQGWDVTVATPELGGRTPIAQAPGVRIVRLGPAPSDLTKYSLAFWWRVRRYLKQEWQNADAIFNVGMAIAGCIGLPKSVQQKTISICHGTYVLERQTLLEAIERGDKSIKTLLGVPYTYLFDFVQRIVNGRSGKVVAVSEGIFASLLGDYSEQPGHVVTIRNFVFTDDYPAHQDAKGKLQLLYVSRLHKEKGVLFMLNALQKLRALQPKIYDSLRLIVAGDGPDRLIAEDMARALVEDGGVEFLGRVDADRVSRLLSTSQIFIFPTLRQEGLPLSLLEAMASGLAVVASNVEGPREVIQDNQSGLLFQAGNTDAFLAKLTKAASDHELRTRLGFAARERVAKEFNGDVQMEKIDALITNPVRS